MDGPHSPSWGYVSVIESGERSRELSFCSNPENIDFIREKGFYLLKLQYTVRVNNLLKTVQTDGSTGSPPDCAVLPSAVLEWRVGDPFEQSLGFTGWVGGHTLQLLVLGASGKRMASLKSAWTAQKNLISK